MNISYIEYTQIFAKIFGDRLGDNVRSGLPLQLMENNGVLKKLSPSTVNSDFCDKLEEYYNNSKKGKKKENLIFLVMLGSEDMIRDMQNTCDFGESPMLIVWPSVWENTKDNIENCNTSIISLHKGKNVLKVCEQHKKNSYLTPNQAIEDLAPQEPWGVNILTCEGIGRIGVLICKDFLIDENRALLCDTLKTTLILVPSYTTGEHSFEILLSQRFQNDCNIAWCNTCSAANVAGAKIENFNIIAAVTSYGVKINSVEEYVHRYEGAACCAYKNCKDCVFIGEIPFS